MRHAAWVRFAIPNTPRLCARRQVPSRAVALAAVLAMVLPGVSSDAWAQNARGSEDHEVAGGSWRPAIRVTATGGVAPRGQGFIAAVSCTSAGDCVAGGAAGTSQSVFRPIVDVEVNGVWGPAELVPGMTALNTTGDGIVNAISCTARGACELVGNGPGSAFVDAETDGTWQPATAVAGTSAISASSIDLTAISCSAREDCVAGGHYIDATEAFQPLLVVEDNGVWGAPFQVPGSLIRNGSDGDNSSSQVASISCSAAGDCLAGGWDGSSTTTAFLVEELDGSWGSAFAISGLGGASKGSSIVEAVSCSSPRNCAAVGGAPHGPFVASEVDGRWGAGQAPVVPGNVSNGYGYMSSVSCPANGECTAAGNVGGAPPSEFLVNEVRGKWQDAQSIPGLVGGTVDTISCAAPEQCSAGGTFVRRTTPRTRGIVVNEVDGIVEPAIAVPGTLAPDEWANGVAISCGSPGSCAVGGTVNSAPGGDTPPVGVVASEVRASPPVVTSIAPRSGGVTGGTRVVIRGRGLADALEVNFGRSLGRHLDLVSPTELIVFSPPGRGVVEVRVGAESGTSRATTSTRYEYLVSPRTARTRCRSPLGRCR